MPRRRSAILKRLSRAHLEGIGRVAADWSLLEFQVISELSSLSNVEDFKTVILAAPSSFAGWIDMLNIFCSGKHISAEIESISKLLIKLLRLRNYAIHAVWMVEKGPGASGIISSAMNPTIITSRQKVKGFGMPKRGRDVLINVEWTSTQLRQLARLIEESRVLLWSISNRKPPTSISERVSNVLQGRTNLHHIRKMLDKLPDPFRKLSKKKVSP